MTEMEAQHFFVFLLKVGMGDLESFNESSVNLGNSETEKLKLKKNKLVEA